ncbi:hypothetical protein D3C81_2180990 [compost metagenome]
MWVSVTAPTFHSKKSGNRETNRQNFRLGVFDEIARCLILKDFKKLARTLLYLWYKNKKNVTPNKNNR